MASSSSHHFFFLLLLLLLLQCMTGVSDNTITVEERQALLALRELALGRISDLTHPPCSWEGIQCKEGHIFAIKFSSFLEIEDEPILLPLRLGFPDLVNIMLPLAWIQYLDMSGMEIIGSIPPKAFCQDFQYLTEIKLSNNRLTGKLPDSLASCSRLRILEIEGNQIYGSLPLNFWDEDAFPSALNISLRGNYLTGFASSATTFHLQLEENCLSNSTRQRSSEICDAFYAEGKRSNEDGDSKVQVVGVVVVLVVVLVLLAIFLVFPKKTNLGEGSGVIEEERWRLLPSFSFEELKEAAGGFGDAHLLREGESGTFYRGVLSDVKIVVRFMSKTLINVYGLIDFYLSWEAPDTCVPLLGYCTAPSDISSSTDGTALFLLVYEYMAGGDASHSLPRLDWVRRRKIALGAAEALTCLHQCKPPVLHGDIKASSILLDENLKVRLCSLSASKIIWSSSEEFLLADDVYSFGKLLLHIIIGVEPSITWIASMVGRIHKLSFTELGEMMDSHILEAIDGMEQEIPTLSDVWATAVLAESCLNADPRARPSMHVVLEKLSLSGL